MADTFNKIAQSPPPSSPPEFKPKTKANRSVLEPPKPTGPSKPVGNNKGRFGTPPGAATPGTAAPSTTTNTTTRVVSNSSKEVRALQQAILDLATIASSTDVTSMAGNQEGRMTGNQTRAIPMVGADTLPRQGEEDKAEKGGFLSDKQQYELNQQTKDDKKHLGGSDALGKFIIQNYIPAESYIGKQYLNVDVAGGANRENAAMAPKDLRGIIDTIKRVGSPNAKGEKTVDGVWQNRTNNSLHVIGDLVQAMLKFTEDMKIPVQGYSERELQVYKGLVPANWTDVKSQAELSVKAKELIPHIKSMTDYFRNLNGRVFNNTNLKNYINQKTSFDKVKKAPDMGNLRLLGVPGIQFDFIKEPAKNWISLNELSSLDNFKEFVNRIGYVGKDPATVKKILDMVSEKLNSKINLGF